MATFAVCAELPAMNVRMAIGTVAADLFEDQADMALGARNLGVHPAQRIARLIVVELGIRADRIPTRIGVALLAGNRERPMRISDFRLWASHARPRALRLLRRAYQQWDESSDQSEKAACALHRTLRVLHTGPQRITHTESTTAGGSFLKPLDLSNRLAYSVPGPKLLIADAGCAGDLFARPFKQRAGFSGWRGLSSNGQRVRNLFLATNCQNESASNATKSGEAINLDPK